MEANFFRALARELAGRLQGARLDKIFSPEKNAWTFSLHASGLDRHLLFRPARKHGLLFAFDHKPENPDRPPARAMWLRKRVSGRRVLEVRTDWPGLRLALGLTPGEGGWLLLDLRRGVSLEAELPESFDVPIRWPSLDRVLHDPEVWREHPQISPPLRRTLSRLETDAARMLYDALQAPGAPRPPFYLSGDAPPLAWPPVRKARPAPRAADQVLDSALEAAAVFGAATLFPEVERDHGAERRLGAGRKRLKRTLARLEQDASRLQDMAGLQEPAQALQSRLYLLTGEVLPFEVRMPVPGRGLVPLSLDPRRSASENLERLFARAAKGRRGLLTVSRRRGEMEAELGKTQKSLGEHGSGTASSGAGNVLPRRMRGMAVKVFTTSDGFTVYRGRNARANHQLLTRAASAFDYWFHAQGVPGAHVVLKRDHPDREVPMASMLEAAALAGLSSAYAPDTAAAGGARAEVMCALVKDVRTVKGAGTGQVRVDKVLAVYTPTLDRELERKLAS